MRLSILWLFLIVAPAVTQQAAAYPIESNQIKVIDADTIAATGRRSRAASLLPRCKALNARPNGISASKPRGVCAT